MQTPELTKLAAALETGSLSPSAAAAQLRQLASSQEVFLTGADFKLELTRVTRTGIPEVILAAGKTTAQLSAIISALIMADETHFLVTRLSAEAYETLAPLAQQHQLNFQYHASPQLLLSGNVLHPKAQALPYTAAVVTAGSSDLPIAEEAALSLKWLGAKVTCHYDLGVAGLNRLFHQLDAINRAEVLIVIAGMDGVLPSVTSGLSPRPIIAVPTSKGYGSHLHGLTPLLTMLNSCAPGITVVNVDNGFGAAAMAIKIFQTFAAKQS